MFNNSKLKSLIKEYQKELIQERTGIHVNSIVLYKFTNIYACQINELYLVEGFEVCEDFKNVSSEYFLDFRKINDDGTISDHVSRRKFRIGMDLEKVGTKTLSGISKAQIKKLLEVK